MRVNALHIGLAFLVGCILTYVVVKQKKWFEGFTDTPASGSTPPVCSDCGSQWPCSSHSAPGASMIGGGSAAPVCPPMPDMSKYVLKSSIPPCSPMPDMKDYMLKTECPPTPDLSQYVHPTPPATPSSHRRGPRPRCPQIQCPPPTVCPACPPCPRATCPQTVVKCKAEESESSPVRPFLAPLSGMFGSA